MIKNYLIVALRNFIRNKIFTLVNILGLATGLTCFILISIYITNELSYDKHHENSQNIYRITLKGNFGGNDIYTATTGGRVGELAESEIPEILTHTTVFKSPQTVLIRKSEKQFYQDGVLYADSGFFKIFQYDFLFGDPMQALVHPNSVVLTESLAKKCFGDENPLGQIVEWDNQYNMMVSGVVRDPVPNSHLKFEALASINAFQNDSRMWNHVNSLSIFITHNYVLVQQGTSPDILQEKLTNMIHSHMRETIEQYNMKIELVPQPITDIHLTSKLIQELEENSDFSRIYIFSGIALLILVIACINFINLSTATSTRRAREVGIRKVFGAQKPKLIRQFILESIIITSLSMLLALAAVEIIYPRFMEFAGIQSYMSWLNQWNLAFTLLVLLILVGLLSGFYPALVLSAYQPVSVLKGHLTGSSRPVFRNVLVLVQFVISAFIIFSAVVIQRQMNYLHSKEMGIDISRVIIVPLRDRSLISRYETLQNELRDVPGVVDVSASSTIMGTFDQRQTYYPEGSTRQHAEMLSYLQADYNFLDVYKADIILGRNFSENRRSDSASIIINETMMRKFGWEDPLGKHLILPGGGEDPAGDRRYKVVGVVRDFHFTSLRNNIEPLIIEVNPPYFRNLNIRIDDRNIESTLLRLESKWLSIVPDRPLNYFFFDERFNSLYVAEQKLSSVFLVFSLIALFIASLGLFGLALYTTGRRTKEIGIRKVFGGSVKGIVYMLLGDFVKWVVLANLIAWPLAWYFMHHWLQSFAYRTQISWWIFMIPLLITMLIAIATVAWQSFRTATQNPAKALKFE